MFNSLSSTRAILYGAIEIGFVLGYNSIENSISLWGKHDNSLGKTLTNSQTFGIQSIVIFFLPSPCILKRKCYPPSFLNEQLSKSWIGEISVSLWSP